MSAQGPPLVVTFSDDIDLVTESALRAELESRLRDAPALLVLDLDGGGFCSVRGAAMLVELAGSAAERGIELVVARPGPSLPRLLHLFGWEQRVRLAPDLAAARRPPPGPAEDPPSRPPTVEHPVRIDPDLLAASIARLEAQQPSDVEPVELLRRVVDAAAELFPVDGVGLMVLDEDEALRYVAATDEAARVLETAQQDVGEGPCLDALVLGSVVTADELATDGRYRSLAPLVVPHGVGAVLGVPVRVGGATVGTLNAYHRDAHTWGDPEIGALRAYAGVVEAMLGTVVSARRHSRVAEQLRYALEHRIVIERSIGYLMAERGVGAVAAFDVLRRSARGSRRKVAEVAADVLSGRDDRRREG